MQLLSKAWGLSSPAHRPDIPIAGSPERCIERSVIEDSGGKLWVLERITRKQVMRRESIAYNLERLQRSGFTRQAPYRKTTTGSFVAELGGHPWQLSPYLQGDPLPQPAYVDDMERGQSLAQLLIALRQAGEGQALKDARPGLALPAYISSLHYTICTQEPRIGARLEPVLAALAPFLEAYPSFPTAFNHGDFHPVNVIWRGTEAFALIDWEFCGYRPALFDVANLLGCVGIEDPQALTHGLAPAFLQGLLEGSFADANNLAWLPSLVLAQRWAWLSEWLRKRDREMVALELDYLDILATNLSALTRAWTSV